MSETIGAVDVWRFAGDEPAARIDGKEYSRVEIDKITYKNGERAGSSYLRAYGVDADGKRRIIKNAFKGNQEGLEVVFDDYLTGWERKPDEYAEYKDTVEPIGVYRAEGSMGGDYDVLQIVGSQEHQGQIALDAIVRYREVVDGKSVPVVRRAFLPTEKVMLFASEAAAAVDETEIDIEVQPTTVEIPDKPAWEFPEDMPAQERVERLLTQVAHLETDNRSKDAEIARLASELHIANSSIDHLGLPEEGEGPDRTRTVQEYLADYFGGDPEEDKEPLELLWTHNDSKVEVLVTNRSDKSNGEPYYDAIDPSRPDGANLIPSIPVSELEWIPTKAEKAVEKTIDNSPEADEIILEPSINTISRREKISNFIRGYKALSVFTITLNRLNKETEAITKIYRGETKYKNRRVGAFLGGVAVGAAVLGAAWLASKGNSSGIEAISDQSMALDNISDNVADQLDSMAEMLEDAAEQIEEQQEQPSNDMPSERVIIENQGPVEDPNLYGGRNIQVINSELGQASFAVDLPEGWTVDRVEGQQVMYDAGGNNIMQVGQEIRINGKPEVLESFMDSQGNISRQGRQALREMGYDLSQGWYEFKKKDGSTGRHFMTIVRRG